MNRRKRERVAAGLIAIFGGAFGIHRFYLGQVGLGILYIFLPGAWLISLIDALVFLTQDDEKFDYKYNKEILGISNTDFVRRKKSKRKPIQKKKIDKIDFEREVDFKVKKSPQNVYKLQGISKYKEYDFNGAIEEFKKALQVNYMDIAVHFNLACAYSISEETENSLFHLDKAVEYGFVDFKKIKEHDAFAFLRIQPAFEKFAQNGYRLQNSKVEKPIVQKIIPESKNLLDQLKKLGELREKGLLTEEEFNTQKQKLLR